MTTAAPAMLRRHVVEFCVSHADKPDLRQALLEDIDDRELQDVEHHLAAWCFSVQTRPGMADHLAKHLSAVADAQRDVEQSHKTLCACHHLSYVGCQIDGGWPNCTDCIEHWNELLDDAVRELFYLLGDAARLDLAAALA